MSRCPWCGTDPLYVRYHDEEWGVPVVDDDVKHFEFLVLEAAQAGLSWITVLRKRERYREVFAGFDAEAVSRFGEDDIARLLIDPGIVRNRQKVQAAVRNAGRLLDLAAEQGSFSRYLWSFVDGRPIVNRWERPDQIPAQTPVAVAIAKDLKRRGFSFVGPTVIYAHLQAAGLVNDHLVSCSRHAEVQALGPWTS